jgi:hypothetical protein
MVDEVCVEEVKVEEKKKPNVPTAEQQKVLEKQANDILSLVGMVRKKD